MFKSTFWYVRSLKKDEKIKIIKMSKKTVTFARKAEKNMRIFFCPTFVIDET